MNVLLINPPNIPFSEQKLLIEPIDVITLGTYLQELKYNVKFLDMDCKKLSCNDLTQYIENKFMQDIVIISYDYHIPLHTQKALENIAEICPKLKRYKIKTIMIGKTVTYNPKIIDIINFDIGIIGETENTIKDILNIAKTSKGAKEMISKVTAKYPTYVGLNYLEMTANSLFNN